MLEKTRDNLATGSFLQVIKIRKLIPDFPGNCSYLVFRVYLRDLNRAMTVLVPQRVHTYIIIQRQRVSGMFPRVQLVLAGHVQHFPERVKTILQVILSQTLGPRLVPLTKNVKIPVIFVQVINLPDLDQEMIGNCGKPVPVSF